MLNPYKTISSEVLYDSKYFRLKKDRFVGGNGKEGEYYYESKDQNAVHAIGIVENKFFLLTKEYRYPIKMEVLQVAGGIGEEGENYSTTAERELFEETGYKGSKPIYLGRTCINPAKADYWLEEYLILDCRKFGDVHGGAEAEETEPFLLKIDEAWDYIKNNKIESCHSVSTIVKALLYLKIDPKY